MAHAVLLMMGVTLLSSGPTRSTALQATPLRSIQAHHPAMTLRGGAIATKESEPPGFPGTIFPQGVKWSLEKAPPKKSLGPLGDLPTKQDTTAAAWILNLVELVHWASFPLGFYAAHYISEQSETLKTALGDGGTTSRVFLIALGLLCQVFGGGISGNMMHVYEGWQVAPFRNPLQSSPPNLTLRVEEFNNAWLRSVAYQMLFMFQTLGLGLFTTAVFGANLWTKALVGGSMAVALLGPKEPRLSLPRTVDGQPRPVLPLSVSLAVVFVINVVANLAANVCLFSDMMEDKIAFPAFLGGFAIPGWVLSVVPSLLIAAGGGIEGWFAEATFNQWHHFIAFVTLLSGLALSHVYYRELFDYHIPRY